MTKKLSATATGVFTFIALTSLSCGDSGNSNTTVKSNVSIANSNFRPPSPSQQQPSPEVFEKIVSYKNKYYAMAINNNGALNLDTLRWLSEEEFKKRKDLYTLATGDKNMPIIAIPENSSLGREFEKRIKNLDQKATPGYKPSNSNSGLYL